MQVSRAAKFTLEQKQQLLANLDIEVAHRTRQLESWLADTLAAFRNRHERQLAVIPHLVRGMKMAEFGDKYDGDIQSALRGLQKERLALDVAPIDRNAMKRKWVPAPEDENDTRADDSGNHSRATKNRESVVHLSERCVRSKATKARIAPPSPQKKPPLPGNGPPPRAHVPRTPGTSHIQRASALPTPSPRKLARVPSSTLPRSPTKPTAASLARQVRVPSTSTFKPAIPKTPAYPPRWPRRDESMLSVNGSPLANPFELGLEWLPEDGAEEEGGAPSRPILRRTASNIVIRRDPSFVAPSTNTPGNLNHPARHSRSDSQSQNHQPHSRSNSRPGAIAASNSGHMAARVAVPTRDGHLLEFDPLLTSPGALDKLEGITDSAKKQAKEDMSRLVKAAVAKWNIK
ncbi:hypothetical protein EDB85DRAFT_2286024 [Lactarius pseudohatsudake]|nr:hypothetical protein EDB85DRAFT_2286024 [Lactarius pseudohatsudake]